MATRKVRTGRKTKSVRRMRTRTKSRRYKVRGGDATPEEMEKYEDKVLGEIAEMYLTLDPKASDYKAKAAEIGKAAGLKMSSIKVMYTTGEIPPH